MGLGHGRDWATEASTFLGTPKSQRESMADATYLLTEGRSVISTRPLAVPSSDQRGCNVKVPSEEGRGGNKKRKK